MKYGDVAQSAEAMDSKSICCGFESHRRYYSYILGIYLGDGCIDVYPRTYRLRITVAEDHPGIACEILEALKFLFPSNKVSLVGRKSRCFDVSVYSCRLVDLFPQHGVGKKHQRKIQLTDWQLYWVDPKWLLRGLIHSDGCFGTYNQGRYKYSKYVFSNLSTDIHKIFQDACDVLGISWMHSRNQTQIAQREDVEEMHEFVGAKE